MNSSSEEIGGAYDRLAPRSGARRMRSPVVGLIFVLVAIAGCTSSGIPSTTGPDSSTTQNTSQITTTTLTDTPVTTSQSGDGVDLVVMGGRIITMGETEEVEAMAVNGNRIAAVGDLASMMALTDDDTTIVDLDGRAVFPGFIDAHSHWYQPGRLGDYSPEQINQVLLSRGWTSTDDPNIEPWFAEEFFQWHRDGRIDLRMNTYLSLNTPGTDQERYGDWYTDYGITPGTTIGDRLRIPGVKIFIGSDWDRVVKWTQLELNEVVREHNEAGWQIAAKQINDEALDMALQAFSMIHVEGEDRRHRLEHALEVRPDQVSRVAALDLVPVVQLGGIESDQALDDGFVDIVSDDGVEAVWPFRDMLDEGLPLVGSIAVQPLQGLRSPFTISVMQMLHGALTGESEVGAQPWQDRSEQLMDMDTALASITTEAAWATFEEDERGALAPGMLADFVVMSRDLRLAAGSPEILRSTTVDATIVDGDLLWCGFGQDAWCSTFEQSIPDRLLDESTLSPLAEGDIGSLPPPTPVDGITMTASASRPTQPPEFALDGSSEGASFWSSGADPPGWIRIDLADAATIEGVNLTVYQNPPSNTVHVLEIRVNGTWIEVQRFSGYTSTGDVLTWEPETPAERVEAVRITTTESASWPEWYDIEIKLR